MIPTVVCWEDWRDQYFSHMLKIPIIGLVGNMIGNMFGIGLENFAKRKYIDYLGELELDKNIMEAGDKGQPFVSKKGTKAFDSFESITKKLINFCERKHIK